ncbi:MAG: hypothetical protein HN849_07130, partial [Victivallales bacterium]|nr:hypothetical protein [Victivallales bacterium]
RFYHCPFDAVFHDPVSAQMIAHCQQRGVPLALNRYVGSAGDQLPQEIARVHADQRFGGFILYETANFIQFDDAGGCSLTLPIIQEAIDSVDRIANEGAPL